MKNIILVFSIIFLISENSFSQISIESNFNVVHIGRNQSLLGKYQWDNFSILAGLKYNFNKESSFPQGQRNFYKKAFWALNFKEHIGLELGVQYKILKKKNFDFFTFYQAQITKSHIRHEVYLAIFPYIPLVSNPQSEYDYAYTLTQNYIGPIWAIENNFGIGLNVYFSNSFYFSTKLGGGILFYRNTDQNNIIFADGGHWELSELISMGVGWKFQ